MRTGFQIISYGSWVSVARTTSLNSNGRVSVARTITLNSNSDVVGAQPSPLVPIYNQTPPPPCLPVNCADLEYPLTNYNSDNPPKTGADMRLDHAVYSPEKGVIYGVFGDTAYKLDANSGNVIKSQAFGAGMSPSVVVYSPINDKVYVAICGISEFGSNTQSGGGIVQLNAETLAVESAPLYFEGGDTASYVRSVSDMIYLNGFIYAVMIWTANVDYSYLVKFDPTANSFTINSEIAYEIQSCRLAVATVGADIRILVTSSHDTYTWIYDTDCNYIAEYYNDEEWYVTGQAVTNGNIQYLIGTYIAYDGALLKLDPSSGSSSYVIPWPSGNFCPQNSNRTPQNIRYNPHNGLLYIPMWTTDEVMVFDPNTDTVVRTATGYDRPYDMVFTPTKSWVVQRGGSAGLKAI
jgi:hypothetical protein